MQFHWRLLGRIDSQVRPAGGVTKKKPGARVIIHPSRLPEHQSGKEGVDETENGLMAAEIFRERNDLRAGAGRPRVMVPAEDGRIGQTEAVNALLDIADQETVGLRAFAAQGLNDGFLGFIDVLEFVHKNFSRHFSAMVVGRPSSQSRRRANCSRSW